MNKAILKSLVLSQIALTTLSANNYFIDSSIGISTLNITKNDTADSVKLSDSPDTSATNFELGIGYHYNKDYFSIATYRQTNYDDTKLSNMLISLNKMITNNIYVGFALGNSDIKLTKTYTNEIADAKGSSSAFGVQFGYLSQINSDLTIYGQYRYLKAEHTTQLALGLDRSEFVRDDHFSVNMGLRWSFAGFFENKRNNKETREASFENIILHFGLNKSKMKISDIDKFDRYASYLNKNKNTNVLIKGYTDNLGTSKYNQYLSEKRAKNVKALLVKKGIKAKRIKILGYGELNPLYPNNTMLNRQKNRAVIISIKSSGI